MVFGSSVVWRYPQQHQTFPVCEGVQLDKGFIIFGDDSHNFQVSTEAMYTPLCYNNGPMLSTFKYVGLSHLPVMQANWEAFLLTETGGFKYSVYPLFYSLTVSTVICIFLAIIVFTNHTQRPSWLLRISSFLGTVNLVILLGRAIAELGTQHDLGFASGEKLLDELQKDYTFSIIDFIFVLLAQFAQVQLIMRLFNRVKEKRVGFVLGGTLSISAQVMWGVSTFSTFDEEGESDITILPAFTYLLRIALAMMYCGLIIIYGIGKRRYIFHRDLILLTILTFITINFQFGFFVADIADVWVSELSEVFNTTIYLSVTVIPWEWINRVHTIERHQQTEGILGRPVYEDEYDAMARYEIITHDDNENGHQDEGEVPTPPGSRGQTPLQFASHKLGQKLKNSLVQTSNALLYFTDQVIAYGLAVPRSVSANSSTKVEESRKKKQLNPVRREVFVYSKKEVVCDSDNEQSGDDSFLASEDPGGEGSSRDMNNSRP